MNLSEALTREHRDIDSGLEQFVAGLEAGLVDATPLLTTIDALRRHIYLEEVFLFPPLRQAGLVMPVMVMLREHGELWQLMDSLTDAVAGDQARDQLQATCHELLSRLDQHNSKEEPIIYPHADTDLSDDAAAELADFLENETTPDGWVCEAAR